MARNGVARPGLTWLGVVGPKARPSGAGRNLRETDLPGNSISASVLWIMPRSRTLSGILREIHGDRVEVIDVTPSRSGGPHDRVIVPARDPWTFTKAMLLLPLAGLWLGVSTLVLAFAVWLIVTIFTH